MPFEWKEIENNWLYSLPISHPKETMVDSFNAVEEWFGAEFFNNYRGTRGQYFIALIMDLSELVEKIGSGNFIIPNNGEIMRNIKNNEIRRSDTIIRLAAHYLRQNYFVESEPKVIVNTKIKLPDLKVCLKNNCIFIEESSYNTSERQKELFSLMEKMASILDSLEKSIWIEVSILKDNLTKEEIKKIMEKSIELSNSPKQPQIKDKDGIYKIVTYGIGQEKPKFETVRPSLAIATAKVGGGLELHLNIQIPFTDARIYKMLDKSAQLSEKEQNMIILDASVSGNLDRLSFLAREFLQPNVHRKIATVLFVQKRHYLSEVKIETRVVNHPNPINPLPESFLKTTMDYFENNRVYLTRKI